MTIKELLSDKSRWTEDIAARDARGWPEDAESPQAVCWCLFGAVKKCYPLDLRDYVMNRLTAASVKLFGCGFITCNDARGYEAVMAVVEEAGV